MSYVEKYLKIYVENWENSFFIILTGDWEKSLEKNIFFHGWFFIL